ncbi:siphovirus Gp157 family protein [Staphylococcus pseudintermedius]|uniref:siphovirus Gp157 family protein n=1 Tax=Staphylococcus pseudintermedius TaxID=283734 RepID=UPI002152ADC5|nr:siphovirus Gp157 family protein [Staphylococcus pseudintermedius]
MEDMKLYNYTESYHNVLRFIDENEDLTYEDLKDTLDAIADVLRKKLQTQARLSKS